MPLQTILRRHAVEAATGKSRSSIYDDIAEEIFPRPLDLGAGGNGSVGWLENEILAYVELRKAARDGRLETWLAARKAELGELEPWVKNLAERIANRGKSKAGPRKAA